MAGIATDQDWFAIVVSGAIKLTKSLPDGRQQIVALLFPSDFLGFDENEVGADRLTPVTQRNWRLSRSAH